MRALILGLVASATIAMSGCSSTPGMDFSEYQGKIMMCEQLGMNVRVINGVRDNAPYVRDVVCYDRRGANWNADDLSEK